MNDVERVMALADEWRMSIYEERDAKESALRDAVESLAASVPVTQPSEPGTAGVRVVQDAKPNFSAPRPAGYLTERGQFYASLRAMPSHEHAKARTLVFADAGAALPAERRPVRWMGMQCERHAGHEGGHGHHPNNPGHDVVDGVEASDAICPNCKGLGYCGNKANCELRPSGVDLPDGGQR